MHPLPNVRSALDNPSDHTRTVSSYDQHWQTFLVRAPVLQSQPTQEQLELRAQFGAMLLYVFLVMSASCLPFVAGGACVANVS